MPKLANEILNSQVAKSQSHEAKINNLAAFLAFSPALIIRRASSITRTFTSLHFCHFCVFLLHTYVLYTSIQCRDGMLIRLGYYRDKRHWPNASFMQPEKKLNASSRSQSFIQYVPSKSERCVRALLQQLMEMLSIRANNQIATHDFSTLFNATIKEATNEYFWLVKWLLVDRITCTL